MTTTSHYGLKIAEGNDYVNPLTVDNYNYEEIDDTMYDNECSGVGTATELTTGTVHALSRTKTTQNVFRFVATSNYTYGDTFTVDGLSVTALYSNGGALKDRCYIIGSNVLCILTGTALTVLAVYKPDAADVPFNDANVPYTAGTVQTAIEKASTAEGTEYEPGTNVKSAIDGKMNGSLSNMEYIIFDSNQSNIGMQIRGIYDDNKYVRIDFTDNGIAYRKYVNGSIVFDKSISWS